MATISYLVQTTNDPDGSALQASRESIAELGLPVDREFIEQPGAYYRNRDAGDFEIVAIDRRPVGRELFCSLRPGDVLLVDDPLVPRNQLVGLVSEMAKRGVTLRATIFEGAGVSAEQIATFLKWYAGIERRCRSRRAIDNALLLKAEGRPRGSTPLGWKVERRRGKKRLVPDPEQRSVMLEIVKHHLNGKGFRQIATLLTKHNVRWKRPDRSRRNGFTWEPWGPSRCERAYHAMLKILAEESAVCSAVGDSPSESNTDPDGAD